MRRYCIQDFLDVKMPIWFWVLVVAVLVVDTTVNIATVTFD